eukprot:2201529-Amphidinium_carterae.1
MRGDLIVAPILGTGFTAFCWAAGPTSAIAITRGRSSEFHTDRNEITVVHRGSGTSRWQNAAFTKRNARYRAWAFSAPHCVQPTQIAFSHLWHGSDG